jgi:hypothetical protein
MIFGGRRGRGKAGWCLGFGGEKADRHGGIPIRGF